MTLVGADGNWLVVAVVRASRQGRDTLTARDAGTTKWPSRREVILDGMRHRVVGRGPGQKGFVVLKGWSVVERSRDGSSSDIWAEVRAYAAGDRSPASPSALKPPTTSNDSKLAVPGGLYSLA